MVVGKVGDAQAKGYRAAEPVSGWDGPMPSLSGPGKLTRALGITRVLNGVDLTGDVMHFEKRVGRVRIEATGKDRGGWRAKKSGRMSFAVCGCEEWGGVGEGG